ncbi:hypothetical protein M436DRAFT_82379 [Aureobasidium namibiae CBS 147.97]|uniref:Rhodopsin domain-containing protein n=1 Tax=Aureobasidium namibiae CBS 147.97 TaxID=1043004 RepID=A0A074WJD4_9PEZI
MRHTQREALIIVGILSTVLGALVILLRGYVWITRRRKQGLDDLFMGIAWIFSIGFAIASFLSVRYGVGLKTEQLPASAEILAMKSIYAIQIFYYLSVFCIKMSIMCLYLRISQALRTWFWKASIATIVLLVAQFFSTILVTLLQCRPIPKYWDQSLAGTCININAFFYSTNAFTVASDILIFALPLPLLWSLKKTTKRDRYAVLAAFMVGFVSTIVAGVRLYSIRVYTLSTEPVREAAPINLWSFVEVNLGMLCTSGPVIKALIVTSSKKGAMMQGLTFDSSRPSQPVEI